MSLCLKISRDVWGTWSVHGLPPVPVPNLPSLSASIDYARKACEAAPATIELFIDGLYVVIHQERGWPRPLLAAETDQMRPAAKPDIDGRAPWSRILAWVRGVLHLSAEDSPAALRMPDASRPASLRLG
jgi:hypothetical protein